MCVVWWVEGERGGRGLLAESGDGDCEGEDGDDELCHADPESCLGHGATVPSARCIGIRKSRNVKSLANLKSTLLRIGLGVTRHPRMGAAR